MKLISLNLSSPPVPTEQLLEQRTATGNLAALWAFLRGGNSTPSGEDITHDISMQLITVSCCVKLIAETIASLPLKLYERQGKGRREAIDNYLYDLLTVSPNPEMSAVTMWETVVGGMACTGNGFIYVQRNALKTPIALWPLDPRYTRWIRLPSGEVAYENTYYGLTGTGKTTIYNKADIMPFPLFSWDGLTGISPIMQHRDTLGWARSTEKTSARLWANGMRPAGVVHLDANVKTTDDKMLTAIKESWQASQSGENVSKTAFLPAGWTYESIGLDMDSMQFIATQQFQRTQIAAIFRCPPHLVGDTSRQSQSTNEQESLSLVNLTLRPYINRIQVEVARTLLPSVGRNAGKFFVEFDTSSLLKGDHKTQYETYGIGKQWGFLTTNQINEDRGENPIGPLGDIYYAPVNYQNMENLLIPGYVNPASGDSDDPAKPAPVAPAKPQDAPATPTEPVTAPTATERSIVQRTATMTIVFRDALGRLLNRNQRDLATITGVFEPVLRSITACSVSHSKEQTGLDWRSDGAIDRIVKDALKGIEKRAAKWDANERDQLAAEEFRKTLRAIVAAVYRELGASTVPTSQDAEETNE